MDKAVETVFATARQSLHRPDYKLSIENLGYAIGLSMQHLYALEQTDPKKISISFDKLRAIVLFLSLKELTQSHKDFIEAKKVMSKDDKDYKKSYFDVKGMPQSVDLDLATFHKLLFTATNFDRYMLSFKVNEDVVEIQKAIYDEFMNKPLKDGKSIKILDINEISHNVEFWTSNDFFSEISMERAAENTARNIVKYKIKYVTFVPNEDESWALAYRKIEEQINILFDKEPHLREYWNNNDWKQYWFIYGIPNTGLRYRIFDALGEMPKAHYIFGGKTLDTLRLEIILPAEVINLRDRMHKIIMRDSFQPLSSSPQLLESIGMVVSRKFPVVS